jgi:hypothetical protein
MASRSVAMVTPAEQMHAAQEKLAKAGQKV